MNIEPGRKLLLPIWVFLLVGFLAALGWLIAAFIFGKVVSNELPTIISDFGVELFRTLIISAAIAILINMYLRHMLGETPKDSLRQVGIQRIYLSRRAASHEFIRAIQNRKNKLLILSGISLRDFLIGGGSLHEIWNEICLRLEEEQRQKLPSRERLRVRILLVDPLSTEGHFRHNVEKDNIGAPGLQFDVPHGLEEILYRQSNIYGEADPEFLQVKLYEHNPFAFMFATDYDIFIEQYYYRDHSKRVNFPLIRYHHEDPKYAELIYSLDVVWNGAKSRGLSQFYVGTATAIESAKIENIYTRKDRNALAGRQVESLKRSSQESFVNILAITGKFYTTHLPMEALRTMASETAVRWALANPLSQQSILRAVADHSPDSEIQQNLQKWDWDLHQRSRLYQDIQQTIGQLMHWHDQGYPFEIRLYSSSISCALLLPANNPYFIEQYLYGRSAEFKEGLVLGGEYPVIEFGKHAEDRRHLASIEREILENHFKVIWNCFSITIDEFGKRDERAEFEKNIARLREELNLQLPFQQDVV